MKETKDGKGYLIFRCRYCKKKFYSKLVEENKETNYPSIDILFNDLVHTGEPVLLKHDCNETISGVGDLIGYTGNYTHKEYK